MSDDNGMKPYWEALKASGCQPRASLEASVHPRPSYIQTTINSQFKFKALPQSVCPYSPSYCIPFPGVEFSELYYGYCSFSMSR